MYDAQFDTWIDYYYDMDELEIIMEEEKQLHSSGKINEKSRLDSPFVEECLDELDAIMKANGGKLPVHNSDFQ